MALRKKFTRTTKGRNQQAIISRPTALSTQATLALFIANATSGQIGVYDAADASHHANVIGPTEKFYIVQKKSDGSIKRTTLLKFSDIVASRKTYVAPVACVGSLGWSGTAGALALAAAPSAGKNYEVAIIETTEGNQPFPTWNYEYTAKAGDVEMDVIQALVKRINNNDDVVYKSNTPLVVAKAKAVGTYGNYTTVGTMTVTNGSTLVALTAATDVTVGDFISFDAAAAPTSAIGDVYKIVAVAAGVSFTLNRPYTGATQVFIAAEASGTRVKKLTVITATGIVFTAINPEEHFRIVARQELTNATIANLSSFTKGNGTPEQVGELELEGNALDGNTAGNTVYGNEGYGNPDRFAITNGEAETYDMFHITAAQRATLVGSVENGVRTLNIIIAAPKSAGGLSAGLNTVLGL